MKVNILGTEYTVTKRNYNEARIFKEKGIDGYCDSISKDIVVCRMATYPNYEQETAEYCSLVEKRF